VSIIINRVMLCGAVGGDDGCLLALLPVPHQQHGGMWMEVLVDLGK
jgi:hypothetical protein